MEVQEIAVNAMYLAWDIDALRETAAALHRQVREIYQYMSELDGMWEGMANQAFHVQFGRDFEQMERLCGTFDRIIACFDDARREYGSCEREVLSVVEDIPSCV